MDANVVKVLRQLKPAGPDGFEGLVASLLQSLTGAHFNLAVSGSQVGRDLSSRHLYGNVIAVECKRYGENTSLDERELLGEMAQVVQAIPDLDVWVLVTSREVPSQLEEVFHRFAEQHGIKFFSISSADGSPSSLEVLCAHSPEIVIAHSKLSSDSERDEIRSLLHQIATHPLFQLRLISLKTEFLSPLVGYASWRAQQNQWFTRCLTSDREARANFGQPINVEDESAMLIIRATAWKFMSKWLDAWKSSHDHLVILGEEGDGKTWATVSWLSKQIKAKQEFPGVVFLSSTELNSYDVIQQLSDVISHRLLALSEEQMERRLRRWTTWSDGQTPRLILILDGINERRTPEWWRILLDNLAGEPWYSRVAVILTCRTSYWNRHFAPLRHLKVSKFILGPYDDNELSEALGHYGLDRNDIQENVVTLVRKPRYFDLMISHRSRISESGDVTVARLVYEDWRDRLERKQNIPLSDADFQDMIRRLAQIHKGKTALFSEQDLAHILPISADRDRILEELRTSAMLQPHGGTYRINEKLLVYGLGLLLVDELEQASADAIDFQEVVSKWLEPHSDMDIKANICEFAALHSLYIEDLSKDAKLALFQTWVESRNPRQNVEDAFIAYLPIDPKVYVALAEIVWSEATNNAWAQEMLISSFLKWYPSKNISPVLRSAFERWLGFVHIHGFPLGRKPEDAEKAKLDISERLGRDIQLGPVSFAGYSLTIIQDDGQLRLARAALAIISHLPRIDFIRAIAVGCVAEAVMGRPDKYELFAWVIRSSNVSLWNKIRDEAEHLLAFKSIVTQQAAYRLLSFEGSQEAIILRGRIVDKIFPTYPHIEQHKQDPCTSGFTWRLKDCYKCLDRNDLSMEWVARQISPYCIDPNLPVPDHLKLQFSSLTKNIDTNSMWTLMGPTTDDHRFEMYESVLMAYAPYAAAELVHSILAEINTRQGMAQRQLSIHLEEHYIILSAEERDRVYQLWNELVSRTETWGETEETAEMFLFKVVLKTLTGDNQLYALLNRPEQSPDLIVYANSFSHVENWDTIRNELISSISAKRLSRLLWFISSFPKEVPQDILVTFIAKLLNHEESVIRFHALEIAYRSENAALIAAVLNSAWAWSSLHCDSENHWGSLLLCKFGKNLPFAEVCTRVHPAYLGHAVFFRENQEDEIKLYADSIHQLWLGLQARNPGLPVDVPNFTVDSTETNDIEHMSRLGLDKESSARSISWRSPHATWGGTDSGEADFNLMNEDAYIERQKALLAILREAIEQQKVAGNFLFGHDFFLEVLDNIVERYPNLVDEWVQAVLNNSIRARRRLHLSRSFYTALCISLFKKKDAEKAVSLYWRLKDVGMGVRVIDYRMKIELIDLALFGAPPTDHLRSAWTSKLEQADPDHGLLQVAVYAQYGTATDWLWSYIIEGMHSTAPITKARAVVLSGFFDDQKALDLLEEVSNNHSDTWIAELAELSKHLWNRNMWAKHWYRQFLVSDDNVVSWASFRLFLKCVDTRFWLWQKDLEAEVTQVHNDGQQQLFLRDSLDDICNAIEKNKKEMAKNFLGQKILSGEIWPWM